jgi:hypothetical protein
LGKTGSSEGNLGQKVLCCAVSGLNGNKSEMKKQCQNKLNKTKADPIESKNLKEAVVNSQRSINQLG